MENLKNPAEKLELDIALSQNKKKATETEAHLECTPEAAQKRDKSTHLSSPHWLWPPLRALLSSEAAVLSAPSSCGAETTAACQYQQNY